MKKIILLFVALLPLLSNAQISLVKTLNGELSTFNSFLYYDSPAFLVDSHQGTISILDDQFNVSNVINVSTPDTISSKSDLSCSIYAEGISRNIYTTDGNLTILVGQSFWWYEPIEGTYNTVSRHLNLYTLYNLSGQILWQESSTSSGFHFINNGNYYLALEDQDSNHNYTTRIYLLPGTGQGTNIREVPMRAEDVRKFMKGGHLMINTPSATYNASGARLK